MNGENMTAQDRSKVFVARHRAGLQAPWMAPSRRIPEKPGAQGRKRRIPHSPFGIRHSSFAPVAANFNKALSISEGSGPTMRTWDGFKNVEAANGHFQISSLPETRRQGGNNPT
jgi:hypothetical protein